MNNSNTTDLTTGKPITWLLSFSMPLVLGTLFQQLYSFVDSIIVGRFVSSDALGSVGATYSLNFLIIGFVQGFCVGLGIPIAQRFGAHDHPNIQRYFYNAIYLCIAISLIFGVGISFATRWTLTIMQTPPSLIEGAITFIQPQFAFIWVTVLYNFSASVLRSFGDSTHPFYFLVLASFLNIALDLWLIGLWHMGITGAAIATIVAQLVSGLLNLLWLAKKTHMVEFKRQWFSFSPSHTKRLTYIALPMGLEYSVSAIGAVIMQMAINSLGTVAVISQTAGEKIRQMFTLPMESIGMGMATYVGQNYGAQKLRRIHQGIRSGLLIQLCYCLFCLITIGLFANSLSELVIGHQPHLVELSSQYLRIMSTTFILHGSLMIYRNTLQGLGFSMQAIFSGVGELVGRGITSLIAIATVSYTAVCLINPVAWALALAYCIFMVNRKLTMIEKSF